MSTRNSRDRLKASHEKKFYELKVTLRVMRQVWGTMREMGNN